MLIQTYRPEAEAVACAARHDYAAFFAAEDAARAELGYPPHGRLAAIRLDGPELVQVAAAARELGAAAVATARRDGDVVQVLGPAEAPLARLRGRCRWQLWLRVRRSRRAPPRGALGARRRGQGRAGGGGRGSAVRLVVKLRGITRIYPSACATALPLAIPKILVVADPAEQRELVSLLRGAGPPFTEAVIASGDGDDGTLTTFEELRPAVVVVAATLAAGDARALVGAMREAAPAGCSWCCSATPTARCGTRSTPSISRCDRFVVPGRWRSPARCASR
ncbi:MAG: hypothetical protein HS111_27845 [Kofleriaceae bacterium]|nr:hypothetical protein [Kofleriaceae bacterium]